jgi:phage-related minor tail protein
VASDTSLVFNLVARDHASEVMGKMKEKFSTAATAISAGVAGAFAVGVTASMDMSTASSKLQAQLGLGPAKAAELSKVSAKIYAQDWGESVGEVDDAIKGVYQQLGDVSKVRGGLQGVTTDVMALAQTFDQDLGGTTAAVGQMIKTGLVKDAAGALDILTKGFQAGDDKAGDLLDTMNEYGVQFHALGINGSMAMGLISQGLKGGARDSDLVADSLKEFDLRARDITSTAPAGFKALGLSGKKMAADIAAGGPRDYRAAEDPGRAAQVPGQRQQGVHRRRPVRHPVRGHAEGAVAPRPVHRCEGPGQGRRRRRPDGQDRRQQPGRRAGDVQAAGDDEAR